MAFTEITCVYALGPIGAGGGEAGVSKLGRAKARVAPSEAIADGICDGGFGKGGLRGIGVGKAGGAGATDDTGGGRTIGSFGRGGASGIDSAARGKPRGVGGAVVLEEVCEEASGLNHPVNPVPAGSFPAIPGAGDGSSASGFIGPKIAVKSPTVFRGRSCGEEIAGVSNGRSPRNGP